MSRIVVHDPGHLCDGCATAFVAAGHEWDACRDHESLLRALTGRRPDVLVHVLGDLARDLEVLSALRRLAPRLPIILCGDPASFETRLQFQELKPTYYGVLPLEDRELGEAVVGALERVGDSLASSGGLTARQAARTS